MFELLSPSRRAVAPLLLIATTVLLVAAAVACTPARGTGSSKCEDDTDCKRTQYCDIDDGETKGKCRSLDANNGVNNGVVNNGGTNNGVVNNGGTNNGVVNNGMTNNGVVNNGVVNNGMTNNGGTNNGGMFTEASCRALCTRIIGCPQFADCSGAVISDGLQQCNSFCTDSGARAILEPYDGASCPTLAEFATTVVDTSSCGVPPNNGQPTFCEQVCDHLVTCTDAQCPGAVVDNCVEVCNGDPDPEANLGGYLARSCTDLQSEFCLEPNNTNAGAACTTTSNCIGGSLDAICIDEATNEWPGGYCSAACQGNIECGDGNYCLGLGTNGETYCTQGCNRTADCRAGYGCVPLNGGGGACIPACTTNTDCVAPATCNLTSGICE